MTSPFVRRRRLATELRTLREESGMTADELAGRIYRSRMTISKLENARCRPDTRDIVKIMKILGVTGDRFHEILQIACDAAERGWWDAYGDTMGPRQRMYADLESGAASIRGYYQIAIPGILQTSDFIWALVKLDRAEGPLPYQPERLVEARLQRQAMALRPDGPKCSLILDEFLLRRLAVPSKVMSAQLLHLIEAASTNPRLCLRVLDIDARIEGGFSAKSPFTVYTFPDSSDAPMAVADTVNTDIVHTDAEEVRRYIELHERLWEACLSEVKSLSLLEATANRLAKLAGS